MTTTTSSIHTTPRRSVRRRAAAAALFATAVAASLAACSDESAHPPRNDVSEWSCTTDGDVVRAGGTITNHSSKTSFYQLDIEFRVGGEVVDERGASVDGVEPGETARVEVISDQAHGDVTCHVTDVARFKA